MAHPDTKEEDIIHRQMTIQEILSVFPSKAQKLAQEITNAGLHCVGCHAATWETLEAGMRGHGYSEDAIEQLLKKLNAVLKKETHSDPLSVTLTAAAAEKFLEFAKAEGKQGCALHFTDKLEGCSGFAYVLDFSEGAKETDEKFMSHGIEIHVPQDRVERLRGSVIDYAHSLTASGFTIDNPHTSSSCGCGTSHNYSKESTSQKSGGGCCGSSSKTQTHEEHDHHHHHGGGGGCCSH